MPIAQLDKTLYFMVEGAPESAASAGTAVKEARALPAPAPDVVQRHLERFYFGYGVMLWAFFFIVFFAAATAGPLLTLAAIPIGASAIAFSAMSLRAHWKAGVAEEEHADSADEQEIRAAARIHSAWNDKTPRSFMRDDRDETPT